MLITDINRDIIFRIVRNANYFLKLKVQEIFYIYFLFPRPGSTMALVSSTRVKKIIIDNNI
jgi:hypothetical protein